MSSYKDYEKAFDVSRKRCREMKGAEMPWELCYELVCCNRQGNLIFRKFMDCKTEMADIVPLEECRFLEPFII
jgi:hypothetical protein